MPAEKRTIKVVKRGLSLKQKYNNTSRRRQFYFNKRRQSRSFKLFSNLRPGTRKY